MPEANPTRTRLEVGLPQRPFLYTLDQIATLLETPEEMVRRRYVHFEGKTPGKCPPKRMVARNISPDDDENAKPDWRVAETEFLRWLRSKGYKFYDRAWIQS